MKLQHKNNMNISLLLKRYFCPLPTRSSKGSHSKKKGPRTPSPPPPVPLDIPVVGKKHKNKHKNKEKSEEKQKDGKDRGRDTEKHKEKKEKRRYTVYMLVVFYFLLAIFNMMAICICPLLRFVQGDSLQLFSTNDTEYVLFCRDRSDSSHKAKRSVTSEEHSGSMSSPSRGTSPPPRKKSTSPKALSHKIPSLSSPPQR